MRSPFSPTESSAAAALQLVEAPGPVALEQPRQGAISEQLAARLARGAVVRFVSRVDDALNGRAAFGARLAEPTVDGHPLAKGSDPLGKRVADLDTQALYPVGEGGASRIEQTYDLCRLELTR